MANYLSEKVKTKPDLAILIPVFKRQNGALRALSSIISQLYSEISQGNVVVCIRDDASPNFVFSEFSSQVVSLHPLVKVDRNTRNLGMSANILSLVSDCNASFCTILTDDDWFEEDSLVSILHHLRSFLQGVRDSLVTSFLLPRYSYAENGLLVTVSCRLATDDMVVRSSPKSTVQYASSGYILSGLFFRPELVDFGFWRQHLDNSFFPVLYFASLLNRGSCVYIDQPWLHHTVDNVCHWEAWGNTEKDQQLRLCRDFLVAINLVSQYASSNCKSLFERLGLFLPTVFSFRTRLIEKRQLVRDNLLQVVPLGLFVNPAFVVALIQYFYFISRTSAKNAVSR